jgi:hypothetical protein
MVTLEELVTLARLGEPGRRASRLFVHLDHLSADGWAAVDCVAVPASWRAVGLVHSGDPSPALTELRQLVWARLRREAEATVIAPDRALVALTDERLDSRRRTLLLEPWVRVCGRLPAWAHPSFDAPDLDLTSAMGVSRRLARLSAVTLERLAANTDRRAADCDALASTIPALLAGRLSLRSGQWTYDRVAQAGCDLGVDPEVSRRAAFGASCSLVGLALGPQLRDDQVRLARRLWNEPAAVAAAGV